jgi:8-oxo-dGTP pyrophosphatase MutT (NUDIX family)
MYDVIKMHNSMNDIIETNTITNKNINEKNNEITTIKKQTKKAHSYKKIMNIHLLLCNKIQCYDCNLIFEKEKQYIEYIINNEKDCVYYDFKKKQINKISYMIYMTYYVNKYDLNLQQFKLLLKNNISEYNLNKKKNKYPHKYSSSVQSYGVICININNNVTILELIKKIENMDKLEIEKFL